MTDTDFKPLFFFSNRKYFFDKVSLQIKCGDLYCVGFKTKTTSSGEIMIKDMTSGNPVKLIVLFAVPLLIGNIFQQLYNISDIIIVGRLIGVEALAAAGASAPIYFTIMLVALGFTAGLCVITAQKFGAKDEAGVRRSVTHSIMASLVLSLGITLLMEFCLHKFLKIMNVPTEIMNDAYKFMYTLCLGLVMIIGYNLLAGFIRALGDSKTPLYFLIFSSVLNILLNLLLIYGLNMGIVGSALGTVISMTISVIACVFYIGKKFPILRLKKEDWKYDSRLMKQHLKVAIPMSLQFSVIAVGLLIIQSVCNSFGASTIAAFTSALRIEQLATQPMVALGLALATYSAQNFGAGRIGRIRRGVLGSSLISLSISVFLALLVRFVGENMIGVFIKDGNPEIIQTAKDYLNITTLFYFFLGQIFIFRNTLQGMGQTGIPMLACTAELVMRSFAAIYLAQHMGYLGICYASPIAWIGAALIVAAGYFVTIRKMRGHYFKNKIKWIEHKLGLNKDNSILPEGTPAE